jgi:peptidoglycan/LPS O-acetylase OafA/YrhL
MRKCPQPFFISWSAGIRATSFISLKVDLLRVFSRSVLGLPAIQLHLSTEKNTTPFYLNGLHGLRAIAAIAVVFQHVNNTLHEVNVKLFRHLELGDFAVTVFFTLSGFLITFLLLKEKEKTGDVSIKEFYIRRILRIWPLYFFYLAIAIVTAQIVGKQPEPWLLPVVLLFASNYSMTFFKGYPYAGHYWSLGVEEQFYLFWPWLIKLSKRPILAIVGFFIFYMLVKAGLRQVFGNVSDAYMFLKFTRFDCMAIGGMGAWALWKGYLSRIQARWIWLGIEVFGWALLVAMSGEWLHVSVMFDQDLTGLATMLIIFNLVANPRPLMRLENRLWRYLGGISFGIYVWHLILIAMNVAILKHWAMSDALKITLFYVFVCSETLLLAHLSNRYLEAPFLRLKERFSKLVAPRN